MGWSSQVVVANQIVIVGPGDGLFLYDDDGNLIVTITAAEDGMLIGKSGNVQMLLSSDDGFGTLNFLYPSSTDFEPATFGGDDVSGYAQVYLNGPRNTAAGYTDYASDEWNSSNGSSTSANHLFFYVDAAGTGHEYAYEDCSGFNVTTCSLLGAVLPGTGTSPSNPAFAEQWHVMSIFGPFSGSAEYRLLPGGNVKIVGSVTLPGGSATYNDISFAQIADYAPGAVRNFPCIPLAGTTYGNVNFPGAPHVVVDTGGNISLYGVPGNLNGDSVDISGIYPL
jgi:hypothetical protein